MPQLFLCYLIIILKKSNVDWCNCWSCQEHVKYHFRYEVCKIDERLSCHFKNIVIHKQMTFSHLPHPREAFFLAQKGLPVYFRARRLLNHHFDIWNTTSYGPAPRASVFCMQWNITRQKIQNLSRWHTTKSPHANVKRKTMTLFTFAH